tara:strand:+ start:466 stop:735 length:270 start_codon:yes stop_codon:yes gene_type:complete
MYSLEISLRYSPFPLSVIKKDYDDAKRIYDEIKGLMSSENQNSILIELKCEKVQDKLITVLAREVISVQMYEKSSIAGGSKRPGFSLDT